MKQNHLIPVLFFMIVAVTCSFAASSIVQEAYIKASNTDANDRFGVALAISGNTLVVGAPWESSSATGVNGVQFDNTASQSGAAYVFVRTERTGRSKHI